MKKVVISASIALLAVFCTLAAGQNRQAQEQPKLHEEVTVRWWLVPVYAIDKAGAPVLDLTPDDIELYIKNIRVEKFDIHRKQFQVTETKPDAAPALQLPSPHQKKMVFLVFDAAFSSYKLLAKAKAIADTVIARSDRTAQYVVLSIEPFGGLNHVLGPTHDLRLLAKSLEKYVEGKKADYLVQSVIDNRDFLNVYPPGDPRNPGSGVSTRRSGFDRGQGGARSHTFSFDPTRPNPDMRAIATEGVDWRDKRRAAASYASALMTLDVVVGQFRDYSRVIYLYSCGVPGDALLERSEVYGPLEVTVNYAFDSVAYDTLRMVGEHFNRSGALLFIVNPAGTRVEEADKDSGEPSLRILATESGGRYFEGADKDIAQQVNSMEGGYYEVSFPDKPEYGGRELNFEIRSKKPGVQIFTVKKVGREKSYADMTEIEREVTVMNILNEGPFSEASQKVSFVPGDSGRDGDSLVCRMRLPEDIARGEWTVFKIARNPATGRVLVDKEIIHPAEPSVLLRMKWRGKEFRHDIVLAHTGTGTILVWKLPLNWGHNTNYPISFLSSGPRRVARVDFTARPEIPSLEMKRAQARTLLFAILLFPWLMRSPLLLVAQTPTKDPFLRWLNDCAQQELRARANAISEIHTRADAEARKKHVRETILEILGGLPDYAGPLHPRITGRIESDGYTIEKIIFESLPGFFVTANLYRPNQPGRWPAVLVPCGHTQEGKPEPQRLAANLALKGFVVLTFDPIGQGEREQTYSRELDAPAAGWSVNEHLQLGAQCILTGRSVARYFIWDARRALDYLLSRPEVAPSRVGAAGCSGGGALTTFLGALDPRLKAVAPSSFINSYELLFAGANPDSEMSFPRLLASGLDTADFVELGAPTPWLIQSTEKDYFTPAGAKLVYDEARRWYGLYDAEDRLSFFVGPGPHGTPLESREDLYAWMIRWLKGGQGDPREQPVRLYTNRELMATRTGHVDDEPGSRKLYEIILEDYRARLRPGTASELLAELGRLGVPTDGTAPLAHVLGESTGPDGRRQRVALESEAGVEIEGTLLIPPAAGRRPAVLVVADDSSSQLAERCARSGRIVLELHLRDSPGEDDHRPYIGNWKTNARADLVGRNLPAMRAHDILRGVDFLAARSDVDTGSIRAAARGVKGVWLLLAAAADRRLAKVWLDKTPWSLRAALERPMNTDLFDVVIPGFALHWDLANLVRAMGGRQVLWTDPTNWMRKVAPSLGPAYRYRYVLGDTTDLAGEQDDRFTEEFLR